MKIAMLADLFPPKHVGGTEIATFNIAQELAKRGHEVHVLTSSDIGISNESFYGSFNVHRFKWSKIKFLGAICFWIKLFLYIRELNPDIIHSQGVIIGAPAFCAKKLLKKPYIIYSQCSLSLYPSISKKLMFPILENADNVIALTMNMKKELSQKFNINNIRVISNGINLNHSKLDKVKSISNDEKIILSVARLRPEKGVEYLIKAIKIVLQKHAEIKLIIVGDGPEKEYLSRLVNEEGLKRNVHFTGDIPNEKVYEYYAMATIFVLPSLSEGFGLVLLEAMATGTPIIATNVCGLSEIIENGKNGFLVNPKNPNELAKGIIYLLENPKLRKKISKNNKNNSKDYEISVSIDKLETVYNEICKKT